MISLVSPSIGTDEDDGWTILVLNGAGAAVVGVVVRSIGGGDVCKLNGL